MCKCQFSKMYYLIVNYSWIFFLQQLHPWFWPWGWSPWPWPGSWVLGLGLGSRGLGLGLGLEVCVLGLALALGVMSLLTSLLLISDEIWLPDTKGVIGLLNGALLFYTAITGNMFYTLVAIQTQLTILWLCKTSWTYGTYPGICAPSLNPENALFCSSVGPPPCSIVVILMAAGLTQISN